MASGKFTGSYELKSAQIIRGGESIEINALVSEMNIFSSIIDRTILGEFLVVDGRNLISGFPVQGGDLVKIKIDIQDKIRDYTMRISKIKSLSDTQTSRMYILETISELAYQGLHQKLSQSFIGPLSDIALQIFEKYTDEKYAVWEGSKGAQTIIIPNWSPTKAIGWLASKAVSTQDDIRFRFFQDSKGKYNFMPIEKAIEFYKDNPPFTFKYRANSGISDRPNTEADAFAISDLKFGHSYDMARSLREGYISGKKFDVNLTDKTQNVLEYNYHKEFDKSKYLNPYPQYYKQDFGDGRIYFCASTQYPEDLSSLKRSSVTNYNQLVQITIKGNPEVDIGQIVKLELPNPDPGASNKGQLDNMWSGKYYVTAKRDFYNGDEVKMVMDCSKESLKEEV